MSDDENHADRRQHEKRRRRRKQDRYFDEENPDYRGIVREVKNEPSFSDENNEDLHERRPERGVKRERSAGSEENDNRLAPVNHNIR